MPLTSPSDITFTFFALFFPTNTNETNFSHVWWIESGSFRNTKTPFLRISNHFYSLYYPGRSGSDWPSGHARFMFCSPLWKEGSVRGGNGEQKSEKSLSRKVNLSACCPFHHGSDNSCAKRQCSSSYARIRVTCPKLHDVIWLSKF